MAVLLPGFGALITGLAIWFCVHTKRKQKKYDSMLDTAGIPLGNRLPPSVYPVPLPRPPTPPSAPPYRPPVDGTVFEIPPPEYLRPHEPPVYKGI